MITPEVLWTPGEIVEGVTVRRFPEGESKLPADFYRGSDPVRHPLAFSSGTWVQPTRADE